MSIRDSIYQRMKNDEFTREELTPDGLHPNDKGHGLVAEEICRYLETVIEEVDLSADTGTCETEDDVSAVENERCLDGEQVAGGVEDERIESGWIMTCLNL